ncbi:kunitz-type serine protease inhibitor superbin-3-like [Drosophila madeirensis]|uniref:Kunitz-type serine protease inhibitor superbin-3-like n=1 Tax=Drosophila madeirensis TaxID=30013 RepID=A0AAU9F2N1_DROMD
MFWVRLALFFLAVWLVYANPLEDEIDVEEVYDTNAKKERIENCLQKYSYGNCEGNRIMWYFDPMSDTCKRFHYSNCGGNSNRFYTYPECMQFCSDYNLKSVIQKDMNE